MNIGTVDKDATDNLDYSIDWTTFLAGDTIATSAWTVDVGLTRGATSFSPTGTVIWLSGGTPGKQYNVTNTITTAGGRTDDATFAVNIIRPSTSLVNIAQVDSLTRSNFEGVLPSDYLQAVIDAVSEVVQDYCGTQFTLHDVLGERVRPYMNNGMLVFQVRQIPLVQVYRASWFYYGSQTQSLDLTYADINTADNAIKVPQGILPRTIGFWVNYATVASSQIELTVDYQAGYTTVPPTVQLAVALLVKEYVESDNDYAEDRPAPVTRFHSGDYSESYATVKAAFDPHEPGLGTSLSQRAIGLLNPYHRVGILFL